MHLLATGNMLVPYKIMCFFFFISELSTVMLCHVVSDTVNKYFANNDSNGH